VILEGSVDVTIPSEIANILINSANNEANANIFNVVAPSNLNRVNYLKHTVTGGRLTVTLFYKEVR